MPAHGAKLRSYDPWAKYTQSRNENRGHPPYMSLVSLVERLIEECGAAGRDLVSDAATNQVERTGLPPPLSEPAVKSILAWSAEHGLLGIFHQTTIQLDEPAGNASWSWINGRWQRSTIWPLRRNQEDRTCLVTGITDHEQQRQRSRLHLQKFLGPGLPDELPPSDSEEFFRIYGESLWDWLWAAITTVEAILEGHAWSLNVLARAATRVRHFEENQVHTQMVFPSLLSAFAEMFFQDREGGTLIGKCANCGEPFTTDRVWTSYCSPKCATKARQRRFLEKNPDYYKRGAKMKK